jgi:hypothetical protein
MKRKLPKATPALAKSVWQSQKRPSSRNVARAMTTAGYPVDFTTVARWKRHGWRANSNDDHPLDVARAKLEAIAPLATGDPAPQDEASAENEAEQMSDAALLRRESQKLAALSAQVWNAAEPHLKKLVRSRTGSWRCSFKRWRRPVGRQPMRSHKQKRWSKGIRLPEPLVSLSSSRADVGSWRSCGHQSGQDGSAR